MERMSVERESKPEKNKRTFFLVSEIGSGSPAEKAGFLDGDLVIEVDGEPVISGEDYFTRLAPQSEAPMYFTVIRAGAKVSLRVIPAYAKEVDRYRVGFMFLEFKGMMTSQEEKHEILIREEGSLEDDKGEKKCDFYLEYEPTRAMYKDSSFPGSDVFEEKRGMRARSFVLVYSKDSEKKEYDLIKKFRSTDTEIVIALEKINYAAAFHDPNQNQVVTRIPRSVGDVELLLHELTHGRQRDDEVIGRIMQFYGSQKKYDQEIVWDAYAIRRLPNEVKSILQVMPEIVEGTDFENFYHSLGQKLAVLSEEYDQLSSKKSETFAVARNFFSQTKSNHQVLLGEFFNKLLCSKFNHPFSSEEQRVVVGKFEELGAVFYGLDNPPPAPADDSVPKNFFKAEYLKNKESAIGFIGTILESSTMTCDSVVYDSEHQKARIRLGMKYGRKTFCLDWDLPVESEVYEVFKMQFDVLKDAENQIDDKVQVLKKDILGLKVSGNIAVEEVLSAPRWIAERDAELGALLGFREIRKETGIDLLTTFHAVSQKEIEQTEQDMSKQGILPHRRDQLQAWLEEVRAKPLQIISARSMVRKHLDVIGATNEVARRLNFAKIKGIKSNRPPQTL